MFTQCAQDSWNFSAGCSEYHHTGDAQNDCGMKALLTYHVLTEQALPEDLKFFQRVTTGEGKPLHVIKTYNKALVGPSTKDRKEVVATDNIASYGVAHGIDGVMLHPSQLLSESPNLVQLAQANEDCKHTWQMQ